MEKSVWSTGKTKEEISGCGEGEHVVVDKLITFFFVVRFIHSNSVLVLCSKHYVESVSDRRKDFMNVTPNLGQTEVQGYFFSFENHLT